MSIRDSMYYDMDGNPLTMEEWAKGFSESTFEQTRRVAKTTLENGVEVSTVLLGLDHGFGSGGRPIIFETMVFGASSEAGDEECERYCTKEEALAGHERIVARLRGNTELKAAMEKRKPGGWSDDG